MAEPIIKDRLDFDQYKLTMAQVAWRHFRDFPVAYRLKNRTSEIALPSFIKYEELREELSYAASLPFSARDTRWLGNSSSAGNALKPDFLSELTSTALSPIAVVQEHDLFRVTTEAPWPQSIWWETIVLAIINELYNRGDMAQKGLDIQNVHAEGERRLLEKIAELRKYPSIKFVEFGTRRRFSRAWQRRVLEILLEEIPEQILGTSNVALAREFGIRALGTHAHEMFMVLYGYFRSRNDPTPALSAHNEVLRIWWEEYGESLSIALTDTFGTEFFLQNFTEEQARNWRGTRQDSGDPYADARKKIAFYQKHGIKHEEKVELFSDGLVLPAIIDLYLTFAKRFIVRYGWGTNLTNDMGFNRPLSLVMKAERACGIETVKLSDNPAKATGPPDEIERVKKEVGYQDRPSQPIVY